MADEQRVYTQYPRESVGAGDWMVQRMQMMRGPDRWAVVRYTGMFYRAEGTLATRAQAVAYARKEWRKVLRANAKRQMYGGDW